MTGKWTPKKRAFVIALTAYFFASLYVGIKILAQ